MKKKFTNIVVFLAVLLGVVIGMPVWSQNLVVNPSFENTSSCPIGISEFSKALNWSPVNSGADTCSSPDLYAACAPNIGGANSPNALIGFQNSRTGSHHAGIILYEGVALFGCNPLFSSQYREYIEGQVSSPLVAGQKYCVKFYVSLANCKWGSDDIGIYFTNTLAQYNFCNNDAPLPVTPQLNWCSAAVLETEDWVELRWTYTANGGENYFVIGNFKNDNNTSIEDNNCSSIHSYAYYFIDDVSITPGCCPVDMAFTNIVQPTCGSNNGSINLGVANSPICGENGSVSYLWSNGATTKNVANLAANTYTVTVTNQGGCTATLSTVLNNGGCCPTVVTINTTAATCGANNGSISAVVSNNPVAPSYLWLNNATTASVSNVPPGTYTVTVTTGAGCVVTASGTVVSSTAPTPPVIPPQNVCNIASTTLNAGNGYSGYAWSASNGGTISSAANAQGIIVTSSGTYTVVVTAANGCTASTQTTVVINTLTASASANSPCIGGVLMLSATEPAGATYSWAGPNGVSSSQQNPSINNVTAANSGTYTVTVTGTNGCTASAQTTVSIGTSVTPTFTPIPAFCSGTAAPTLPSTSNNGIAGTWLPTVVSNTTSGTYNFTPNAGQCASTATVTTTVNPSVTPIFTPISAFCSGTAAPTLPNTSNNGIAGTWLPTVVSNTASGTYSFTPNAGQCATTASLSVTVNPSVTPTFTPIPAFCSGITAPSLPSTSNNGIAGTWLPTVVSNTTSGTYNFTPNAGQCASAVAVTTTVNSSVTPTFTPIPAFCSGTAAPTLPNTSNNGIAGTWSPTVVSNTASGTYSFTPNAGQCATTASLSVTVNPSVTPTFTPIPAFCSGTAAPTLPSTSNNGIAGAWLPTTVSNTTSGTYSFTPNAGQCASTATLSVTVNALPNLNVQTSCAAGLGTGSVATTANASAGGALSYTINGVADADGNETNLNNGTYTVLITENPSTCTAAQTVSVNCNCPSIVVNGALSICQNTAATYTQTGGNAGGQWSVSPSGAGTVDANGNFVPSGGFSGAASISYAANGCTGNLSININPLTTPTFTPIPAFCSATTASTLPSTSNNGIVGTWLPATISNTTSGTYSFTPNAGQCASTATLSVTVNALPNLNVQTSCAAGLGTGSVATTANASAGGALSYTINGVADADGNETNLNNGTYTVLITENPSTCTAAQTVSVNCNCPSIVVNGALSICQNTAATYTQTGGNAGGQWSVSPSGAGTVDANGNFVPSGGFSGAASISYAANGCTGNLSININPLTTPAFTPIPAFCSGTAAPSLPSTSNNGIVGTWLPTVVSNTTSGTYNFTPNAGQCASAVAVTTTVNASPNFNVQTSCAAGLGTGSVATTANASAGGALSYTINGVADADGNETNLNNGTYTVLITENPSTCTAAQTVSVNCNCPTITIAGAASICQNATATNYTQTGGNAGGQWSVSPSGAGTVDANGNFVPSGGFSGAASISYAANGCTGNLSININPLTTPTFNPIPAFCSGTAAPSLPNTSNNGISGTWSPTVVSNTTSGTYNFTPNAGQCASVASLTVTVNPSITPTFNPIPAFCSGTAAPSLPSTSNNGVAGTWLPATISNTTSGTYNFTPNAGQCASAASLSVTVNPSITPTFTPIPAFCSGTAAPSLPSTSNNGVAGTWLPATISNTTSGTYNFTPNAGQCASAASLSVTVNPSITPTFTPIPAFCSGTAAPTLPSTSNNGIVGTWLPTVVSNTTSGTYAFTPNAGQCATTASLSVAVNSSVTPTFNPIPAFCSATTASTLPSTSNNGIVGTWLPATISNTTSGTYSFTPNAGQCASTATLSVTVNALPNLNVQTSCAAGLGTGSVATTANASAGGALSYTINGVADADGNETNLNNGTYTVLITENPSTCTAAQTVSVNCNCPSIVVNGALSICQNTAATYTQTGGNAGGQWSVSPSGAGTVDANGNFVPSGGFSGAASISYAANGCTGNLSININPLNTPTFTPIPAFCSGTAAPSLSSTSNNGIAGTWSPATISNTTSGTYNFTPNAGQCASAASLSVTVDALPNLSVQTSCGAGLGTGNIATTANASAGGALSYAINGVADADGNQTSLNNGTYTVLITENPSTCTAAQTVSVNCNCPSIVVNGALSICQNTAATYTQTGGNAGGQWSVSPSGAGTVDANGNFVPSGGFSGAASISYAANGCTGNLSININPLNTPTFTPIPAFCSGTAAPSLSSTSNNGIAGTWSPATISNTTSGTYNFTPNAGQCASAASLSVTVDALPNLSVQTSCGAGLGTGNIATTANASAGGALSYAINGVADADGNQTSLNNGTYTVLITENPSTCTAAQTVSVNCNCPTITIAGALSICQNTAATYTQTGGNAGGQWSVNPSGAGTVDANGNFVPSGGFSGAASISYAANGCTGNLSININPLTTPTFNPIPAFCSGTAAPSLPNTSNNGIAGTWSPATISNTTSGTYSFTPNAGQCASTATLSVTVNALPNLNVQTSCAAGLGTGSVATTANASAGGALSYTINGVADADGNETNLNNGTYTVLITENPSTCTAAQTVSVNCNCPSIVVNGALSICQNTAATYTQTGGNAGGQWSVSPSGAGTVDANGNFVPSGGFSGAASISYAANGCTGNLSININPLTTPAFTPIPAFCSGTAAPSLPSTSNNGIVGTWLPTVVSNTTSGTYNFTPNAGQCASAVAVTTTVNASPNFNVQTSCAAGLGTGSVATTANASAGGALSYTINGVADADGNQMSLNNGTYTVLITENPSTCTAAQTVSVNCNCPSIVVNGALSICQNTAATYTQTGGNAGGQWAVSPSGAGTVDANGNFVPSGGFSGAASISYAANGCTGNLSISINPLNTPTFTPIPAFCSGTAAPTLPSTSNNGIAGTWLPTTINNTTSGTYNFTPNAGQCASAASLSVAVNALPNLSVTTSCGAGLGTGSIATTANASAGGALSYAINGVADADGNETNLNNGTYTVLITENPSACTAAQTVSVNCNCPSIVVNGALSICQNTAATYTQTGGNAGGQWSVSPSGAGTVDANGNFVPSGGFSGAASISYAANGCTGNLSININPLTTPTFTPIPAFCSGTVAPTLPSMLNNGIAGTWSPATVSNTASGTYSFTPNVGQCATTAVVTTTVNALPNLSVQTSCGAGLGTGNIATTANASAGGALSYAINGVADADGNQTSLNNGTYTVLITENPSTCTAAQTVSVNCNCPTITIAGALSICQNAAATYTQTGGNAGGQWSVSPSGAGAVDANGNFVPSGGFSGAASISYAANGCTGNLSININPLTTPTFTPIPAFCSGTAAPTLPSTSNNGIAGAWLPTTVSNTTSGTYSFTPNAGQCASTATLSVTVNALPNLNVQTSCAAGLGTGSVATTANASAGGALSYTINGVADADGNETNLNNGTYTVLITENPSTCTAAQTVSVNCNCPSIVVNGALSICQNTAATYTQTGGNAGGQWSVSPSGAGTVDANGNFVPSGGFSGAASISYAANGCTGNLSININPLTTPTFTPIPAFCSATTASTLPSTSNNGIVGTWLPATISNTTSGTYSFTPNAGQCASTATLSVTVNALPNLNVQTSCAAGLGTGSVATTANASAGGALSYTINGVADADGNETNLNNGTYTVLITENPSTCTAAQTVSVNCNCPSIVVNGALSICQNTAATYTQTGGNAGGQWSVSPSGAGTVDANGNFVPSGGFSGAASISYAANGCTGNLSININPLTTPAFTPIPAFCSGTAAPSLPSTSNNGIVGTWLPTVVSNTTSGTYNFTPNAGQCASAVAVTTTVNASPNFNVQTSCAAGLGTGSVATTANASAGGALSYTINGVADADGNQMSLNNGTYTVLITENPSTCTAAQTVSVNCNCPSIVVNGALSICQNTAATYTQTGGNAGGQWAVSPSGAGTVDANGNFVPSGGFSGAASISYAANGCTGNLSININPLNTPTFTPIPAFCSGTAAPSLSSTSNNGIAGTWSPATISNTTSGTYNFTPNAGQCASAASLSVTVDALPNLSVQTSCGAGLGTGNIATTANASAGGALSYAINGVADADGNQTSLNNGTYTVLITENPSTCTAAQTVSVNCNCPTITIAGALSICQNTAATYTQTGGNAGGQWSVNPSGAGTVDANGNFVPSGGFSGAASISYAANGCTGNLSININPLTTPTFNPIPAFCSGTAAPSLPNTSNNGIAGTWSPATISNTTSGTYNFTPNAGQCASAASLSVTVNPSITPTFTPIPAFCSGTAAPTLPSTSNNGIVGTWLPTVVSNTTSGTYAFTPNAGQCATTASLSVAVNSSVTPTFNPIPAFCSATTASTLPSTSNNGIVGTWLPATISNTTSGTYSFTPNAGQCASTATLSVTVNALPNLNVQTSCAAGLGTGSVATTANASAGGALSYTINGVADADGNETNLNNGTYTVLITENPSTCTAAQTVSVNCNCPSIVVNGALSICQNTAATYTQTGGNAGGQWSVNPSGAGTVDANGNFVPSGGFSGAASISYAANGCTGNLSININPLTTPTFNPIPAFCSGTAAPSLPNTSNNGIAGTWSPATISNTTSGTYSFTPNAGQCASTATLSVTVNALPNLNVQTSCAAGLGTGSVATTANASAGGALSYTINGVADADGNETNLNNGTYTVLITENPSTCTAAQTVSVNCNCPSIVVNGALSICQNTAATYTQTGGNAGGQWSVSPSGAGTVDANGNFVPSGGFSGAASISYAANGCTGNLSININPLTTPAFTPIPAFCSGTAAPSLPSTSNNGIVGTWLPTVVSNTTSGTYNFTPNAGQCASAVAVTTTVNASPNFNVQTSCAAGLGTGSVATTANASAGGALSYTINGVADADGNQMSLNNGTYTVLITENPSTCTAAQTVSVNCNCPSIVVNGALSICQNTAATYTQTGGNAGGQWAVSPSGAGTVDANGNFVPSGGFSGAASISYAANGCTGNLSININPLNTPTFTPIPAFCSGTAAPSLSSTSNNGIAGTWSPATISNTTSGTYNFTPNAGQCASAASLSVTVDALPNLSVQTSCGAGLGTGNIATTANASAGGALSYAINGVADADGNQTSLNNGTYTVLITENPSTCTAAQTVSVNCNCPTITIAGALSICQNTAATYTQTGGNAGGQWSVNPSGAGTVDANGNFVPSGGFSGAASISYAANGCTGNLSININPLTTPTFNPIPAFCSGTAAPSLPNTSNNGIAGTWSPATISNTTSGTYNFTPNAGQCASAASLSVTVNPSITPTFTPIPAFCSGTAAPTLPSTSNNGIVGTWLPTVVSNTTSGTYAFTPNAGQCATTASLSVAVNSSVTPTFNPIPAFCSATTASTLPSTSNNGIVGTWLPATISNTTSGTYSFTPNAGQCASTATLSVTVNALPNLNVQTSCAAGLGTGSVATTANASAGGALSYTINGVADADGNETNLNNGTYTVLITENPSTCTAAQTVSVNCNCPSIVVNGALSICQNTAATYTQTGGNAGGQWSVSPSGAGTVDANGNFVPSGGFSGAASISYAANGCTGNLSININPLTTPTFTPIPAFCSGTVAPTLPSMLNNGIAGTWSPATVSNTASGTYSFTPNVGQCATTAVVTTTVNALPNLSVQTSCGAGLGTGNIATTANASAGGALSYAINGVADADGNQTSLNNGTYTVLITENPSTCTAAQTVSVNCNCPTITIAGALSICQNAAATYTQTGGNAGGQWSVSPSGAGAVDANGNFVPSGGFSGAASISYAANGCTGNLSININPLTTPTFTPIPAFCSGTVAPTLPSMLNNGIAGTWSPATISNTTSGTYNFTPNAGQCASVAAVTTTVNPSVTPTFTPIPAFCSGTTAPSLPSTSNNGIAGTWLPTVVSNTTSGTYNFTPNAGQCASAATVTTTVNPSVTPTFTPIPAFCSGTAAPTLPNTSNNGIAGTWLPTVVSNTTSGTYNFTPNAGQCASAVAVTTTVNALPNLNVLTDCGTNPSNGSGMLTITASVPDGSALEYAIDGVNFQASNVFSNLNNGAYIVTVRAISTSCIATASTNISCACIAPTLTVSSPNPICQNATGNATISLSNNIINTTGTPPTYYSTLALANAGGMGDVVNPDAVGAGTYFVRSNNAADSTCFSIEPITVVINNLPAANISGSQNYCVGDAASALSANGGISYVWNNGTMGNTLIPSTNNATNTTYTVTVTDANTCQNTAEITVNVSEVSVILSGNTLIELGDSTTLHATAITLPNSTLSYTWLPTGLCQDTDCSSITVSPNINGIYSVTVSNEWGCLATDNISLQVTTQNTLVIPNAFSPNGDNVNEVFHIGGTNIAQFELLIYDRWGQKTFETQSVDLADGWDGKYPNGIDAELAVYVYYLNVTFTDGKTQFAKGNVTLVR